MPPVHDTVGSAPSRAVERAGRRAQKVVETMVTDLGCAPPPKFPTRAVAGAWLALRAEAAALQELRRKVQLCFSASPTDVMSGP